ncbi:MAG: DciA family protein [Phycisphaerales bacterium]|nr:DciA family protein [Phycisphaerales bacterium]
MLNPKANLERLRKWRARPNKDLGIDNALHVVRKGLRKGNRQLNSILEIWDERVPQHIAKQATIVSLRGGVLEVTTDGAAISYQLNRLIRGGLLRDLQRASKGTLKKIKVRTI